MKMARSPSPHPTRLAKESIQRSPKMSSRLPRSADSPLNKEEMSNPKATKSSKAVPSTQTSSCFAEIQWKTKNPKVSKESKSREPSAKVAQIIANINGAKKKASLSNQASPFPSYRDIPTAASYDESTATGDDWMQARYLPDDGNIAII